MSPSRYIFPVVLIILSGLLYVQYIKDAYANIRVSKARVVELRQALNSTVEIQSLQEGLKASIAAFSPTDREHLAKMIPQSIDNVRIIYDINTIAARHNLILKSPGVSRIPDNPSAPSTGPKETSVQFSVFAPYSVFKDFLGDLEKSVAIADINSVQFAGSQDARSGEGEPFNYAIELRLYSTQ